jgi:hypothetical protein
MLPSGWKFSQARSALRYNKAGAGRSRRPAFSWPSADHADVKAASIRQYSIGFYPCPRMAWMSPTQSPGGLGTSGSEARPVDYLLQR